MLQLTIIGRLGADATVREVGDQRAISFNVAHSERYTDRQGQQQERTTWVSCTLWRSPERLGIVPYLVRGGQVWLRGVPSARAYEANGEARASLDLRVLEVELLGGKQDQQAAQPAQQAKAAKPQQGGGKYQAEPQPEPEQDDLPF